MNISEVESYEEPLGSNSESMYMNMLGAKSESLYMDMTRPEPQYVNIIWNCEDHEFWKSDKPAYVEMKSTEPLYVELVDMGVPPLPPRNRIVQRRWHLRLRRFLSHVFRSLIKM